LTREVAGSSRVVAGAGGVVVEVVLVVVVGSVVEVVVAIGSAALELQADKINPSATNLAVVVRMMRES
jgi:hypothetical protein